MRTRLTLLLISGIALPAVAADPPPAAEKNDQAKSIDEICKSNPFEKIPAPKIPDTPKLDPTTEIKEGQIKDMRFDKHCKTIDGKPSPHCNHTLGQVLVSYYRGNRVYVSQLKTACDSFKIENEACSKQSGSRECAAKLYSSLGKKFEELKQTLDDDLKKLRIEQAKHLQAANKLLPRVPRTATGGTAALSAQETAEKRKRAKDKIEGEASTGGSSALRSNQRIHTDTCANLVGDREFCGYITAAADAKFYAVKLSDITKQTSTASIALNSLAQKSGAPDNKGLLDSVGGLDGIMKMATLGMMGAGLYCQVSGQCGNQQSSVTDPNAAGSQGLGATSPTPSSTNPGSSLGDNGNKGGSTAVPGATFTTATDTSTSNGSFAGPGGSGFSADPPDQDALKPFEGNLSRAPASAAAPGGAGGGGSEGDSSGSSSTAEEKSAGSNAVNPDAGASGLISGGGGLPAHGGFSLSSSPDAPAADAALKSILNGDDMPGDPGLASILDEAGSGMEGSTEQSGIDLQDAESLFFRIKETHVRCVKRGCVGREVGEKI